MKYNLTAAIVGTGFMGKQYAEILCKLVSFISSPVSSNFTAPI